MEHSEAVPSKEKARLDSAIRRVLKVLPASDAHIIALTQLSYRRKSRRMMAFRLLRERPADAPMAERLRNVYEQTGDQEVLHLIARSPAAVAALDNDWLVPEVQEDYWRMRVLQALIISSPKRASPFADHFPYEFAWAAGRVGTRQWIPTVRRIARSKASNAATLRMAVWYFGKVSANADVVAVTRLIRTRIRATRSSEENKVFALRGIL